MSVFLTCPTCGSRSKAPDGAAGRRVKCPKCGAILQVGNPAGTSLPPVRQPDSARAEGQPERRECPYCSETIMATARKCKHCGEIIDPELKESRRQTGNGKARRADDYDDDYDDDPRAQARTPGGGNDAVGIIGLILGCISGVLVMAACCTGGVTLFAAVPFSVIGFIVSVCGTGTPKTLGLVFNSLVFIPAVILLVLMLCGFATYLIHRP